jgi:hypothetical protein
MPQYVLQALEALSCATRALRLLSQLTCASSADDALWRRQVHAAPLLVHSVLDSCFMLLDTLSRQAGSSSSSSSSSKINSKSSRKRKSGKRGGPSGAPSVQAGPASVSNSSLVRAVQDPVHSDTMPTIPVWHVICRDACGYQCWRVIVCLNMVHASIGATPHSPGFSANSKQRVLIVSVSV